MSETSGEYYCSVCWGKVDGPSALCVPCGNRDTIRMDAEAIAAGYARHLERCILGEPELDDLRLQVKRLAELVEGMAQAVLARENASSAVDRLGFRVTLEDTASLAAEIRDQCDKREKP